MRQVLVHHLDDAPAGHAREHVAARRRPPGYAALPGRPMPSASTMLAIVEAVPIVMQWPWRAVHAALGLDEVVQRHRAGAHLLAHLPHAGARAELLAAPLAVEHRPAGDADRRQVDARRAHQQRRRGLVAAHQQHDAVDRVAADRSPRRPCWRGCGTASRSAAAASRRATSPGTRAGSRRPRRRRCFTCSASVRKCALQGVSSLKVLQMPITGRPSNWSCGHALVLDPAAVDEAVAVLRPNHSVERSLGFLSFGHAWPPGYAPSIVRSSRDHQRRRRSPSTRERGVSAPTGQTGPAVRQGPARSGRRSRER